MCSWKSEKDLFSFLQKTIFQLSSHSFQGNWLWNYHHYWCVRFLQSRFLLQQAESSLSWLVSNPGTANKICKEIRNKLGLYWAKLRLKLELELCFTSFKICSIKLIKQVNFLAHYAIKIRLRMIKIWPKRLYLATTFLGD